MSLLYRLMITRATSSNQTCSARLDWLWCRTTMEFSTKLTWSHMVMSCRAEGNVCLHISWTSLRHITATTSITRSNTSYLGCCKLNLYAITKTTSFSLCSLLNSWSFYQKVRVWFWSHWLRTLDNQFIYWFIYWKKLFWWSQLTLIFVFNCRLNFRSVANSNRCSLLIWSSHCYNWYKWPLGNCRLNFNINCSCNWCWFLFELQTEFLLIAINVHCCCDPFTARNS